MNVPADDRMCILPEQAGRPIACATAPITLSMGLLVLVAVSSGWLPETESTRKETSLASNRATIASRTPTDRAGQYLPPFPT
jgi:hypothetical protein